MSWGPAGRCPAATLPLAVGSPCLGDVHPLPTAAGIWPGPAFPRAREGLQCPGPGSDGPSSGYDFLLDPGGEGGPLESIREGKGAPSLGWVEAHWPGIRPLTPAGVTEPGPRPCGDSGPLLGNLGSRDCSHHGEWHPGGPGKQLRAELSSGLSHAGAPPGPWRSGPDSLGLPRGGSGPRTRAC